MITLPKHVELSDPLKILREKVCLTENFEMELRKKVRTPLCQKKKIAVRDYQYKAVLHRNTFKESKMYDIKTKHYSPIRRNFFGKKEKPFVWMKEIKDVPMMYLRGYRNFLQIKNLRNRRVWNIPVVEMSGSNKRRPIALYRAFILWLCQKSVLGNAFKNVPSTYFISQKRMVGGKHSKLWNQSSGFAVEIAPLRHLDINTFKDWRKWFFSSNLNRLFSLEYHQEHFGPEEGKQEELLDEHHFYSLLRSRIPSKNFWNIVKAIHDKNALKKLEEKQPCYFTELRKLYHRKHYSKFDKYDDF